MDEGEIFEFLYNEGFIFRGDIGLSVPYTDATIEAAHDRLHPIEFDTDLEVTGITFDEYLLHLQDDRPLYWIFSNTAQGQVQNFILKQAGINPWPSVPELLYKGYGYAQEVLTIKDSVGKLTDITIKAKEAFKVDLSDLTMDKMSAIPQNLKKARAALKNLNKSVTNLTTNIKNLARGVSDRIDSFRGLTKNEPTVLREESLFELDEEAVPEEQEAQIEAEEPSPEIKVEVHDEPEYQPPPEKVYDDDGAFAEAEFNEPQIFLDSGALGENMGGGRAALDISDLKPEALDFYYQYIPPGTELSSAEIRALNKIEYDLYFLDEDELAYRVVNHTLVETQTEFIDISNAVTKEQVIELFQNSRYQLTTAQRDTLYKRWAKMYEDSLKVEIDPVHPEVADQEITEIIETAMNDIVDAGVPQEAMLGIMLESEGEALLESVVNPALFILNVVFFALMIYALYKRLVYTWKAGGVILPLQPPIWLFDWSKLAHQIVDIPQDVVYCFDREKLKTNPSSYFRETLMDFVKKKGGSFPLKEGIEWEYKTTTNFFVYKRDPRQDGSFSFSSLSPTQWFVNEFQGWVQWKEEFPDGITNGQVQQAYYNIVMAMGTIYGIDFPMDLRPGYDLPTVQSQSRVYFDKNHKQYNLSSIWKGIKVPDWDTEFQKKNWHDSNPKCYEFRWNSGINVTLVNNMVAQFRRLLDLKLRTEDYWYLLPNLSKTDEKKMPWRYDANNNEWILKPAYHRAAGGGHSLKLVSSSGIDIPLATGTIPAHYWVLTENDAQKVNDDEPGSESEEDTDNITGNDVRIL